MNIMSLLVIVVVSCAISRVQSLLFPVESESRQLIELGGLWDFKVSPNESTGFDAAWHSTSFKKLGHIWEMPVPSSFNDIVMDASIRDHIGWVWYQRSWFASRAWSRDHNRVFIRFGSVHYWAKVWLNGKFVGDHQGGHLPFEFEITDHLVTGSVNLLTVAVNNRLHPNTLPQGRTTYPNSSLYPEGYSIYSHSCDYFDFSGINRPVYLYTTPRTYVKDVEFSANVVNQTVGALTYNIITSDVQNSCTVKLLNKYNKGVAYSTLCTGTLTVEDVRPWWPVGMNNNQDLAYLYTLQVQIGPDSNPDIFRQTVGFRTITWDNHGVQINGENLYIHGFGMHEDSNIKGRGFDSAVLMRDINLLQWVGANAIRTSHYPYAEETIAALERYGILVIVETPGCSIGSYDDDLLKEHKRILEKTIDAHRKRANVIMWSIANEPSNTTRPDAVNYFKELAQRVKELDPSRPSILVTGEFAHTNASTSAFQYVDIIGVNRYASWYRDSGKLSIIQIQVPLEMNLWHRTFDKPVLITEYGAGSLSGQHVGPAAMWSEDYQVQTLRQYFRAFDNILRSEETFFLGEMIWNFIDFKTPQGTFIRDISNVPRDSAREVDREWARNSASVPYSREDDVLLTDRHGDSIADMFKRDTQSSAEVNECQCGVQCSCPSSCSCRQKKSLLPSSRVQAPVYLENNAAGKIEPQFHSLAAEDNAQIDENCPPAQFTTPCCSTSCCRSTCASKLPPCCDSKLNPESNPKLKAEPNPNLNPEPNIALSNVDSMDKTLTADPDSNLNAESNSNLNDEANPNLDPELNPILNLEPNLLMSNVDSIDKSGTLAETAEPNSNLNAEPNSKLNAKPNPNSNLNAEPNSNLNAEPNSNLNAEPNSNLNAEPNSNSNLNAEPNPNSMVSNAEHKSNLNPKNNPNLLQPKMDSIDTSGALTASVETNSNQMESIADSNDVGSLTADNLAQVGSDNTGSISADTIGDQSDNMASISADNIGGQSDNVASLSGNNQAQYDNTASLSADTQESDISNMASLSADGNIGVSSDNTASLTLDAGNVGSIRDTIDALSVKKDTVPTYNDEVFRNPGSSDKTNADKLSQASNDQIDQGIAGNQANMRQAYGNNVNAAGMKNDADPAKTNVYTLNDVNIDSTNARDATDAIDSPDATSADARNSQSANSRDVKDVAFGNSLDVRNKDAANSLDRNVDENLMDSSISQSSNSPDVKNVESANTIDASVDSARTFDSNNVESSNTLDASNTGVTNSLNGRNADSANALGDTNSVNILDSRPDSDNSLEGTNFESAQKLVVRTVDNTEERDNMASVGAKHPATFRIVNPREYEITRSKINALNNDYNEEIRSKRDLLDTMETIQPLEDTRQADCYL